MTYPTLPSRLYDCLKWLTMIVLPNCGWLYGELADIWNLPYGNEIPTTVLKVVAFLGVVLGFSTVAYNKTPTTEDVLEYADWEYGEDEDDLTEYDLDEDGDEE